jgi:hypothetical protein
MTPSRKTPLLPLNQRTEPQMSELTAYQKGARLMARLLMHGGIKAEEEARRLEIPRSTLYSILSDLSGLHDVPVANDRGWWYVQWLDETDYDAARRTLAILRAELDDIPPASGWSRPFRRNEVRQMARLIARMVDGVRQPKPG